MAAPAAWPFRTPGMRRVLAGLLIAAMTLALPSRAAAQPTRPGDAGALSLGSDPALHATRGVVKSITTETLVLSRPGQRGDISFTLTPAVHRDGGIVVGATVSVRYRDNGKEHIATAIARQEAHENARHAT